MTSVIVCDDHGIIRSGIARILETTPDFQLMASASTGARLLETLQNLKPDLLVLDIRLTDCSGLDLLGQIAIVAPETRVVMLSMYGAKGYVDKAKSRGARGYITKECLDEELVSVLHAVMRDEGFVSFPAPPPATGSHGKPFEANIDALSSRELEVMKFIASGLTNTEIGEELSVSPRTVESHRASIQRKLLIRTRAELARVARDAGLLD
ncbi:response regulator transcription factor [Mycobacterium sp. CPCC 205372]|uniref:Response regulator transcription factor n=1 Tax=Mycobacterium hippophais TaxID=3016340 RepID=A0ABT4PSD3_9MYCO|nr:response regulator transcription factor [Mycobacterium hippophais]MCZ8379453.1 response regulator transcription factor [Mycobacterium hippophais]